MTKREKVIELLVEKRLKNLSEKDRYEQLETMISEAWDDEPKWKLLPKKVQQEFEDGELLESTNSKRYDDVLRIWLSYSLQAVSNNYLSAETGILEINGKPVDYFACPCCGRKTINERGHYSICQVCWWEDSGQDNKNADNPSSPNEGISLTKARYNFIKFGLYNPERKKLFHLKSPNNMYDIGRKFKLIDDKTIVEVGTNWKAVII